MDNNPRVMIHTALLEKANNLQLLASRENTEENTRLRAESLEYMKLAKQYAPLPAEKK